jgi:hypothetical protein
MSDNWRTPPWLLEILFPDGVYYDPCEENPDGLRTSEGLTSVWPTRVPVFLNPPYSDPGPWLRKAAAHPGPIVCLVKSDHSTEWHQRYGATFRIVRIGQRLRFIDPSDKGPNGVANFPSELWFKSWPPKWVPPIAL